MPHPQARYVVLLGPSDALGVSQLTHWMDVLFTNLFNDDFGFRERWERVPYINCEDWGESHSLAGGNMLGSNADLMRRYDERPPHALKFWKTWSFDAPLWPTPWLSLWPTPWLLFRSLMRAMSRTEQCGHSNDTCAHTAGFHALALARRCLSDAPHYIV
jgi:hypothetical protein